MSNPKQTPASNATSFCSTCAFSVIYSTVKTIDVRCPSRARARSSSSRLLQALSSYNEKQSILHENPATGLNPVRVATYTQPSAPTKGSLVALCLLVLTILLGTGVVPTLAAFVGGPIERLITPFWGALYALAFLGLMFSHGINWISWLIRYRILLVFLMLGTIFSVSWSIDAQVSAERTVHLIGSTLIAIYIGFTVPLLITLRVFAVVLGICIFATIATALGMPDLGIESYEGSSVWRGVFNSKNDLGFWAGVGVLLYVTLSDSTHGTALKLACFLLAGLCLAILALSQSATSLLAMLMAGSLSLYLFIAIRFQLGFIRMAVMAILFVSVIALVVSNIDTAELVGRTGDLTGRGEVWRQTWELILQRPLTGFGYGSIWFPTDATIWIQQSLTDFTWVVHHAHNGLLQVASEVGMPLALIALLMVAQQLIEIFYCQYERQQVGVLFVLAFVAAFLISNFSEARFLVTRELFWIFFIALPISMLRQINLVSVDETSEEQQESEPGAGGFGTAPAYGAVPGKPWLGPWQNEVAAAAATSAATAGAALLPYNADQTGGGMVYGDRTFDATYSEDEFDLTSGTMSFTEADIDLSGEFGDPDKAEAQTKADEHDDTLDLTESEDPSVDSLDDSQSSVTLDVGEVGAVDNDDIDRYDIDFDITGEWVDLPLDDDK
ncbi:MAG: O-antigen ligase family protein [Granulosicoccus sp.]